MDAAQFLTAYAAALASQDWQKVAPLIDDNACITFSTGAVHTGIAQIRQAYERNFALIKNEEYIMSDVRWLHRGDDIAVYVFSFSWQGIINEERSNGSGHGTSVIRRSNGTWKLLTEHLGK